MYCRPGNFSSHARSCLELLIDVLVNIKDLTSLLFIAQQLTKSKVDPSKWIIMYMYTCMKLYINNCVCYTCMHISQCYLNTSFNTSYVCTLYSAHCIAVMYVLTWHMYSISTSIMLHCPLLHRLLYYLPSLCL